jgi:hypothetical protein
LNGMIVFVWIIYGNKREISHDALNKTSLLQVGISQYHLLGTLTSKQEQTKKRIWKFGDACLRELRIINRNWSAAIELRRRDHNIS